MSGSKGLRKERLKYTNAQVEALIAHNTQLLKDVQSIRMPREMTPEEFNDVVKFLRTVKVKFESVEEIPQPVDDGKA